MIIGIWGDSITFGSCDEEALGWAGRLRKSLPVDDGYQLYNFGICGDTTKGLLKRFKIEAEAIDPDKIIFAIGINDSKFPSEANQNNIPTEVFADNLKQLIDLATEFTNDIILVGPTIVADEWRSVRGSRFLNEEIEKYDSVIQKLSHENGLQYISMLNSLNPSEDLAEGLHPNAQGYQKMYKIVKKATSL